MVRRKKKAQAKQKRKPFQWLIRWRRVIVFGALFIAVSVGAGFAGQWLLDPEHLPIRNVEVHGEFQHLTNDQLRQAVADVVEESFFTINVDAIRNMAEALPWVKQAAVRRVWPDTVIIDVTEQVAAARWGEAALLNRRGELFEPDIDTIPDYLPELVGPDALRRQVMERYVAVTTELTRIGHAIRRMEVNDRRSWRVQLDNGVELRLGREMIMERLQRFLRAYPSVLAPKIQQLEYVDLRYANGFSVRWTPHDGGGEQRDS
jgi:cell division protein FtsQ